MSPACPQWWKNIVQQAKQCYLMTKASKVRIAPLSLLPSWCVVLASDANLGKLRRMGCPAGRETEGSSFWRLLHPTPPARGTRHMGTLIMICRVPPYIDTFKVQILPGR